MADSVEFGGAWKDALIRVRGGHQTCLVVAAFRPFCGLFYLKTGRLAAPHSTGSLVLSLGLLVTAGMVLAGGPAWPASPGTR